jgi:histidine triad (HIT) family protein
MSNECIYCEIVKNKKACIIYEDGDSIAFLPDDVITPGHIKLIPKEHFPIIEFVPDNIVGSMFNTANKLSEICFQLFKAQGTNIFIQNGPNSGQSVGHFSIDIIPRQENDGLDLSWEPKQASKDDLSTAELMLKPCCEVIEVNKNDKSPVEIKTENETITVKEGEIDYQIESLNRMP